MNRQSRTAKCHRRARHVAGFLAMLTMPFGALAADQDSAPSLLAFLAGKVVTMDDDNTVVNNAVVLVRDGKIERVGE